MPQAYYLTHVSGAGVKGDPRRPAIPAGINFACAMTRPPVDWAVCAVNAADVSAMDADPDNIGLPANLDQTLTNAQRNRVNAWATNHGIAFTATSGQTFRQVVNALGNILIGGGFSIDQLQVSG